MFLSIFLICNAADTDFRADSSAISRISMHAVMMEKLFDNLPSTRVTQISQGKTAHAICSWPHCVDFFMTCKYDRVIVIHASSFDFSGNLNIDYLPPSVHRVAIIGCQQAFALHTRLLPKYVSIVDLHSNEIFGTVSLQDLPRHIQILDVSKNRISGPIDLRDLPEDLRSLYIHLNSIQMEVVYCHNMPAGIDKIIVGRDQIGRIHVLSKADYKKLRHMKKFLRTDAKICLHV